MTDYTIAPDEQGAYELHLTADEAVTVTVEAQYVYLTGIVRVTQHSGTAPAYVRVGQATHVGDPKATMIPQFTWLDIPAGPQPSMTLHIVSADDAVVSVARQ